MDQSNKPASADAERDHQPAIVRAADATVREANDLLHSSGGLKLGNGLLGTIVALVLGFLCLLGVLAFHFPQYLTTPELRHAYSVDVLRKILFVSLLDGVLKPLLGSALHPDLWGGIDVKLVGCLWKNR